MVGIPARVEPTGFNLEQLCSIPSARRRPDAIVEKFPVTPRTAEALLAEGISPYDLLEKTIDSLTCAGVDIELAKMRLSHYQQQRESLVAALRTARATASGNASVLSRSMERRQRSARGRSWCGPAGRCQQRPARSVRQCGRRWTGSCGAAAAGRAGRGGCRWTSSPHLRACRWDSSSVQPTCSSERRFMLQKPLCA